MVEAPDAEDEPGEGQGGRVSGKGRHGVGCKGEMGGVQGRADHWGWGGHTGTPLGWKHPLGQALGDGEGWMVVTE